MFLVFAGPIVIFALVVTVPIAYRYLWPIKTKRPKLFLLITLAMGLVIAAVASAWFLQILVGIGIAGASPGTADAQAVFESVLRNRLLVAAVLAVVIEYLLCRITQTIMGT